MQTTLPVFRVAGLHAIIRVAHQADDLAALWQNWLQGSLKDTLPAFSKTVYCVRYDYQVDGSFSVIIGYLVANDTELEATVNDVWLPSQQYQVYTLSEKQYSAALSVWTQIAQGDLSRRFQADFESYPAFGDARVYVGIEGQVNISEEF
ncbi:GyrI-like domain-containing protein [Wielerella bovis]|uniref:effector binding domain-containing protein n=1 Tax=Wielerella bovis TaxID=2917790 RepID=UPI00201A20A6|nr:effector binding domain-containing protein [Wielerella bovis]ULJ69812.1 GyrI-like domain-containing protein [Wielerella bovis]